MSHFTLATASEGTFFDGLESPPTPVQGAPWSLPDTLSGSLPVTQAVTSDPDFGSCWVRVPVTGVHRKLILLPTPGSFGTSRYTWGLVSEYWVCACGRVCRKE